MFICAADLGSNNSGYYDLQAVLTHQGRSSSSGHYVGWVKRKEGRRAVSPQDMPVREMKWTWRFLLSSLPLVRRVVQVRRRQGQRGVSRGYPATVWRRGLAYSICSTVRPPAAGTTWRVARPPHPTHASKIAISKHCLHPCAVNPVSLKNLMTLTFVFVTNANAYKILSKYSTDVSFGGKDAKRWWEAPWTGPLTEVFKSGSAASLNVLYTLYIFKASDKVLI